MLRLLGAGASGAILMALRDGPLRTGDLTERVRYELTEKARRGMALIAGIGPWRRRHIVATGTSGLTPREVGGILRTALPLVTLPEHAGKSFGVEIGAEARAMLSGRPSPPAAAFSAARGRCRRSTGARAARRPSWSRRSWTDLTTVSGQMAMST